MVKFPIGAGYVVPSYLLSELRELRVASARQPSTARTPDWRIALNPAVDGAIVP